MTCCGPLVPDQVLELLRRRGQSADQNFDAMGLLRTLCLVKMDAVDSQTAAKKRGPAGPGAAHPAPNAAEAAERVEDKDKVETEMKGESGPRTGFKCGFCPATCVCVCVSMASKRGILFFFFPELAPLLSGNSHDGGKGGTPRHQRM